jgi:hypothetical protein
VVDVTRGANAGETIWTFSGSAIATEDGVFSGNDDFSFRELIRNIGNFTDLNTFDVPTDGGSVSGRMVGFLTQDVGGGFNRLVPFAVDSIFVDNDQGANADDIAFGIAGTDNVAFSAGERISWTGALTVTGFSIENLTQGGFKNTLTASAPFDFQLNIDLAPVPLPAGVLLLSTALVGLRVLRRRQT